MFCIREERIKSLVSSLWFTLIGLKLSLRNYGVLMDATNTSNSLLYLEVS